MSAATCGDSSRSHPPHIAALMRVTNTALPSRDSLRPSCADRFALNQRARRDPQVRARGMPGARCTRGPCAKGSKHTVVTTVAPGSPGIPARNGFNGFLRALPGDRLIVTVTRVMRSIIANLTPAPGRQDHTTSPSAICAVRQKRIRVHRIPHPTSVTIAKRPSYGARDSAEYAGDLGRKGSEIFFKTHLDDPNHVERIQENLLTDTFKIQHFMPDDSRFPFGRSSNRRLRQNQTTNTSEIIP